MFNLENAIQNWRRKLRSNPAFEDGDIAELESHLREEVGRLKGEGLSEEEAFRKAVKRIGEPENLGQELYKTRATGIDATPAWKQTSWVPSLLPNYVKVAVRNFRSNLGFSTINVMGLSVALSVALLVITFTKDQADYDAFHSKAERIYRVNTTITPGGSGSPNQYASSPLELGPIMETDFPEVVESVRLRPFSRAAISGENRLRISGYQADSTFFKLFDFKLETGNPDRVLSHPNSIVLTPSTAERFFGNANPVGKTVTMKNDQDYVVTGLLSRQRTRSHLEFEALVSMSREFMETTDRSWKDPRWYTYILTGEKTDPVALESKLPAIVKSYNSVSTDSDFRFELQRLTEINLGPLLERQIGRITPVEFVYFLSGLALLIMMAAGINYVNLTVARSLKRVKEIGLRKVIGAGRHQLIGQFLSESIVIATISLGIGLLIFGGWLLPSWNSLRLATADFGRIAIDFSRDWELYLFFFGFTLAAGFLAGVYPAFKISAFSPVRALRSSAIKEKISGWSLRRFLVVFQIALSVVLVVSAILLYRQSDLLLNTDFGFQKSNIINVELGTIPYELLKNEVGRQAGVVGISAVSNLPGVHFPQRGWVKQSESSDSIEAAVYSADEGMLENFGLPLAAGRNFSSSYATDEVKSVILNEMAVQRLNFNSSSDAVGELIHLSGTDETLRVAGVVENFQFDFLWEPISPLIIRNDPSQFNIMNVQLKAGEQEDVLSGLSGIWKKFEPVAPFDYTYYSDQVANVYADFKELAGIVALLSVIAILIACLGLLAMAHYDTRARIKEIGIRKVLGADVKNLVLLLSTDFAKMIVIALLIGIPVTVYVNSLWLQIFAYKVELDLWIIGLGAISISLLAFSSIGWQTIHAATMNPVKNLRTE